MKKEMKFSELPEKVQVFLICNYFYDSSIISLNWLHNKADWTKATNDERLAYAEFMFPVGTKCKALKVVDGETAFTVEVCPYFYDSHGIAGKPEMGVLYLNGEWAEIIAAPDEIGCLGKLGKIGAEAGEKFRESLTDNKPIFKVGDRPEWTVDLIKQLPHGTELECPFHKKKFTYSGQEIFRNPFDDIMMLDYFGKWNAAHFRESECGYAKILSLPDSYLNPVKPEEEFQAGEIVEARDHSGWYKFPVKFLGVKNSIGMYACEFVEEGFNTNNIGVWNEIRKIKPDPDAHLKELAEEVLKGSYAYQMDMDRKWICESSVNSMLIEMGKKVQDKIK